MNEKTRKNLEDTMNDCLDRAYACEADSEDYVKYISKATSIANILNEEQKIQSEKEVELKKVEQGGEITKKDVFLAGAPILTLLLDLGLRNTIFTSQMKRITDFELHNTYTTSGGRWITSSLRDIFNFNGRRGR